MSFDNANFYLRGNRLINYQQLGLKAKLYLCEVGTIKLRNLFSTTHVRLGPYDERRASEEKMRRVWEDLLSPCSLALTRLLFRSPLF